MVDRDDGVIWITLANTDVELITQALEALGLGAPDYADRAARLSERLRGVRSLPAITVGVYGGVVQWVQGNPFPIRIIDYDGSDDNLPDRDDAGAPCSLWIVKRDPDLVSVQG